jgi:hypothetical protein
LVLGLVACIFGSWLANREWFDDVFFKNIILYKNYLKDDYL